MKGDPFLRGYRISETEKFENNREKRQINVHKPRRNHRQN